MKEVVHVAQIAAVAAVIDLLDIGRHLLMVAVVRRFDDEGVGRIEKEGQQQQDADKSTHTLAVFYSLHGVIVAYDRNDLNPRSSFRYHVAVSVAGLAERKTNTASRLMPESRSRVRVYATFYIGT